LIYAKLNRDQRIHHRVTELTEKKSGDFSKFFKAMFSRLSEAAENINKKLWK